MFSVAYQDLSVYELGALTFRLLRRDYETGYFDKCFSESILVDLLAERIFSPDIPYCKQWSSQRQCRVSARLLVNTATSWWSLREKPTGTSRRQSLQQQLHPHKHVVPPESIALPENLLQSGDNNKNNGDGNGNNNEKTASSVVDENSSSSPKITTTTTTIPVPPLVARRRSSTSTKVTILTSEESELIPGLRKQQQQQHSTSGSEEEESKGNISAAAASSVAASVTFSRNNSEQNLRQKVKQNEESQTVDSGGVLVQRGISELLDSATSNNNNNPESDENVADDSDSKSSLPSLLASRAFTQGNTSSNQQQKPFFSFSDENNTSNTNISGNNQFVSPVEVLFRFCAACPQLVVASTRRSLPRWSQPVATADDVPLTLQPSGMTISACSRLGGDALLGAGVSFSLSDTALTKMVNDAGKVTLGELVRYQQTHYHHSSSSSKTGSSSSSNTKNSLISGYNPFLPPSQGQQTRMSFFLRNSKTLEALVLAIDQPAPLPKVLMSSEPIKIPNFWRDLKDPEKKFTIGEMDHRMVCFAEMRALVDFGGDVLNAAYHNNNNNNNNQRNDNHDNQQQSSKQYSSSDSTHHKEKKSRSRLPFSETPKDFFESHFIALTTSDSRVIVARIRPTKLLELHQEQKRQKELEYEHLHHSPFSRSNQQQQQQQHHHHTTPTKHHENSYNTNNNIHDGIILTSNLGSKQQEQQQSMETKQEEEEKLPYIPLINNTNSSENSRTSSSTTETTTTNSNSSSGIGHSVDSFVATVTSVTVVSPWTCVRIFVCGQFLVVCGGTQLGDIEYFLLREGGLKLHRAGVVRAHAGAVRTLTKAPEIHQSYFWSVGAADNSIVLSEFINFRGSNQTGSSSNTSSYNLNNSATINSLLLLQSSFSDTNTKTKGNTSNIQNNTNSSNVPQVLELRRMKFEPSLGSPKRLKYDKRTGYLVAMFPNCVKIILPALPPNCDIVELMNDDDNKSSSSSSLSEDNDHRHLTNSNETTTTKSYHLQQQQQKQKQQTHFHHILGDIVVDLGIAAPTVATCDVKGLVTVYDLRTFKVIQSMLPVGGTSPQHMSISTFERIVPFASLALAVAADHCAGIFAAEEVIPMSSRPTFHEYNPCKFLAVMKLDFGAEINSLGGGGDVHSMSSGSTLTSGAGAGASASGGGLLNISSRIRRLSGSNHSSSGSNQASLNLLTISNAANVRMLADRMLTSLRRRVTVCRSYIVAVTNSDLEMFAVDSGRIIPTLRWTIPLRKEDEIVNVIEDPQRQGVYVVIASPNSAYVVFATADLHEETHEPPTLLVSPRIKMQLADYHESGYKLITTCACSIVPSSENNSSSSKITTPKKKNTNNNSNKSVANTIFSVMKSKFNNNNNNNTNTNTNNNISVQKDNDEVNIQNQQQNKSMMMDKSRLTVESGGDQNLPSNDVATPNTSFRTAVGDNNNNIDNNNDNNMGGISMLSNQRATMFNSCISTTNNNNDDNDPPPNFENSSIQKSENNNDNDNNENDSETINQVPNFGTAMELEANSVVFSCPVSGVASVFQNPGSCIVVCFTMFREDAHPERGDAIQASIELGSLQSQNIFCILPGLTGGLTANSNTNTNTNDNTNNTSSSNNTNTNDNNNANNTNPGTIIIITDFGEIAVIDAATAFRDDTLAASYYTMRNESVMMRKTQHQRHQKMNAPIALLSNQPLLICTTEAAVGGAINKLVIVRPVIVGIGSPSIVARIRAASGFNPTSIHFSEEFRRIVCVESPTSTSATTSVVGATETNNRNYHQQQQQQQTNAATSVIAVYSWTPLAGGKHQLIPLSFFKPFETPNALGTTLLCSDWDAVLLARSDRPEICAHSIPGGTYLGSLDAFSSNTGATNSEWQLDTHRRKVVHEFKSNMNDNNNTNDINITSSNSNNEQNEKMTTNKQSSSRLTTSTTTNSSPMNQQQQQHHRGPTGIKLLSSHAKTARGVSINTSGSASGNIVALRRASPTHASTIHAAYVKNSTAQHLDSKDPRGEGKNFDEAMKSLIASNFSMASSSRPTIRSSIAQVIGSTLSHVSPRQELVRNVDTFKTTIGAYSSSSSTKLPDLGTSARENPEEKLRTSYEAFLKKVSNSDNSNNNSSSNLMTTALCEYDAILGAPPQLGIEKAQIVAKSALILPSIHRHNHKK